jgi:hypothetical protein
MESIHEFFDFIGKVITSICGILLRPVITLNIHYCHSLLLSISFQLYLSSALPAVIVFAS